MRISNRKKEKNKIILIIAIIVVLALTAGAIFWVFCHNEDRTADSTTEASTSSDNIDSAETPIETPPATYIDAGTKVVEQYDGQTEADTNSIEFDNEQFRIPEEDL